MYFELKMFLDPHFFYPKSFWTKKVLDIIFCFWPKRLFLTKLFLTQNLFDLDIFRAHFFAQNIFGLTIFLDLKYLWPKFCLARKFLGPKICFDKSFLDPKLLGQMWLCCVGYQNLIQKPKWRLTLALVMMTHLRLTF